MCPFGRSEYSSSYLNLTKYDERSVFFFFIIIVAVILLFGFGTTPSVSQSLLPALCLGITLPDNTHRTMWGARDQNQVGCVQGQHPTCCTSPGPKGYSFLKEWEIDRKLLEEKISTMS